jgi:ketosteroid isomerase-like protein
MKKLVLLASLLVAFAASAKNLTELNKYQRSSSGLSESVIANPLPVQMESMYVTDQSRWGQLIFDRGEVGGNYGSKEEIEELAALIESYHQYWLDGNNEELKQLLDENITRFRQGRAAYGITDVLKRMSQELRGERPEGFKSSMQFEIRDMQIRIHGDFSSALYRIAIHGGARWEYADLATIFQIFRKVEDRWKLIGHTESLRLDDSDMPPPVDNIPNRRAPFRFDFVYPVKDLKRAIDFYSPLLGPPIVVKATRASFRMQDSYFELEAKPIDERIIIVDGNANGYGLIEVDSLTNIASRLSETGSYKLHQRSCGNGQCMVTEDPSGNVLVWREREVKESFQAVRPTITFGSGESHKHQNLFSTMRAWMATDLESLINRLTDNAVWVDDALSVASGTKEIKQALQSRWQMFDRGTDGLDGDLIIKNARVQHVGGRHIVTFETTLDMRNDRKNSFVSFVTQVWVTIDDTLKLEQVFLARARTPEVKDVPVSGMDYTAYPVTDLGVAGRFYKIVLESEPYRDDNWFGFWSTTSVFGLVGEYPDVKSYSPIPHQSNGYADFNIRSADEVYEYLQSRGSAFPLVEGINDVPGIDLQPGYKQILAVDSEGNLINFSQYLEY